MKDALIALQTREGMSDRQLAAQLGISRSYWNMIRLGSKRLTEEVKVRAVRAWPELRGAYLDDAVSALEPNRAA